MKSIRIRKGLDVPIAGRPEQRIDEGPLVKRVAVLGPDYPGLRPAMAVAAGDAVRLGQPLFSDRKNPRVAYTAPGSGRVAAIHRGDKRALLAVEIALGGRDEEAFTSHPPSHLPNLPREVVVETLLAAGLWPALRRRPFDRVPDPAEIPSALFVTALDTEPLAADPTLVIRERAADFFHGLQLLATLSGGPLFLCRAREADFPVPAGITPVAFSGPHPAGLPGTHIHFLHPVGRDRCVWHIGYQDVMAVGHLFTTGRLLTERIVALGGPGMRRPRLVRSRLGAALDDLLRDELDGGGLRVVSGSVLNGRSAQGPLAFLGRYHQQVTALPEGGREPALGWLRPGSADFSIRPLFFGALDRLRLRRFTTAAGGGARAIYPIGTYEQVMPLDLSPTYLLRALAVGDGDEAQALGCLELVEEDLALCSFVCPGKNDFGPMLRSTLDRIEKEG